MGRIAIGLSTVGNLGVSSRGSGTVKNGIVQDNFQLKTWDIVLEPSVADSVMSLVREQTDLVLDAGANHQLLEEMIKDIKTVGKQEDMQKYILESFKKLFR